MEQEQVTLSILEDLKKDAYKEVGDVKKTGKKEALGGFWSNSARSLRFILSEKENIFFAFLQLAVIALAYYLWIQIFDLIPEDVWKDIDKKNSSGALINIVFAIWSFVCVGFAAYPLGILTACMGASFVLRFNGQPSTILGCLRLTLRRSWSLWIFSWIDAWWTVMRILERLPKKNDRTPLSVKLMNEAIYQAWKLVSLGFIPALICGRAVSDACKDSLSLTKNRFSDMAKLRFGYSLVCWIFGILGYVGFLFLAPYISSMIHSKYDVYGFYTYVGVPLVLILSFIMLIFRPLYIISACRIYANYAREANIRIKIPEKVSGFLSSLVFFLIFVIIIAYMYVNRDENGIAYILQHNR